MSSETVSTPATQLPAAALPFSEVDAERRDVLAGRLFHSGLEALELLTVYFGERLGLYRALAEHAPATPFELAARAGTDRRYTREWLEQQAVAGILDVDDATVDAETRRYRLPAGHAEVLLDRDSLAHVAPLGQALAAVGLELPALLEAFRTGRGVGYADYGPDAREAQEFFNRPAYINLLPSAWLPAIPDVHARLEANPPARVADLGCGAGWSSIAIARAYPKVHVDGFDLDELSIARARANAATAGVAERVTFHMRDASDVTSTGHYDLVAAFETIHDLGRPVEALRAMRNLATSDGAVIVMDERVGETFTAPGDELERFLYAVSVLWCLPQGRADGPSPTGTVMRPDTLRRYALEAGYRDVEILPIEHEFFRFYRLVG